MISRKKPGVAFWATVALVAVLAYPLSFGPACWWLSNSKFDDVELESGGVFRSAAVSDLLPRVPRVYWPFGWLALNGPEPLTRSIRWYGTAYKGSVVLPIDWTGSRWYRL